MNIKMFFLKNTITRNLGLYSKRIIRNIKFLCTNNLSEIALYYDMDIMRREFAYELSKTQIPTIKSINETFEMLIHTDYSFCRFGDGEFENILHLPSPFQNTNLDTISRRLIEVLSSSHPKIAIGLPRIMYTGKADVPLQQLLFWRRPFAKNFYQLIEKHCSFSRTYYAAEVTLPSHYKNTDMELFFKKARQIWESKDISIIAGKGIFKGFKYDIFDNAKSIEKIDAPNKNAFEKYDQIFKRALQIDKNRLVIIILGQTATVLAYDLALCGYRALDLGHIAKAYEWYCSGKNGNNFKFFLPDE